MAMHSGHLKVKRLEKSMKMKKREGSNSGEYSCSMCSFRSVSLLNVEAHDRFAHKDKKTLNDRTSLYDGQSKGPTRYACAQCPFESTVKSTLLAHVHSNHLIVRVPNNNNNVGKDRSSFFS